MPTTAIRTSRRATATIALAAFAALAMVLMFLSAPISPAHAAQGDENPSMPQIIPSIDGWRGEDGTFTLSSDSRIIVPAGDEALAQTAQLLADELAATYPGITIANSGESAGDIVLTVDAARSDLGAEGYELKVSGAVTVTAKTQAGAFYGTRTISQMFTQQAEVPRGEVTDIPAYAERGVTLCACVINISPDFIDRLIEQMSYLKLNTLMVELKVKVDKYPQTNTWSYYTKDQVKELVAKANRHHIDVIPEINSPGHMEIWLENMPELQLTKRGSGEKDEVRLDITEGAAFDFYTDLIDEYSEVFTSKYWHMGADEYMLGSDYSAYPQMLEFAHDKFGPTATEDDVVLWYVNKINDYVRSKGKTLRMWNDGSQGRNKVVDLDSNIVVEHWNQAGSTVKPQDFVDAGHEVVNVSNALYMVRGGYGVDVKSLYNQDWEPTNFYGSTVSEGVDQIRGARMSAWPDAGTPDEAENVTEQRMFEPLNFVAQTTWSDSKPWASYDGFKTAMDDISRPPLWNNVERQPLPAGTYQVSVAGGEGALASESEDSYAVVADEADALTFTPTDDGYYVITRSVGKCLDISRDGTMRLEVPVEIGAQIQFSSCDDTTIQKWQVKKASGGYYLINAASQQHLSISTGLNDVPVSHSEPKDVPDGLVVQTPSDWGATVFRIIGDAGINATLSGDSATAGESVTAQVEVTNTSGSAIPGATIRIGELPKGWTATPRSTEVGDIGDGENASTEFTLFNIAASDAGPVSFELVDAEGQVIATTSAQIEPLCTTKQVRPVAIGSVSSEQPEEPGDSGPATAAIDGDPATYWHSRWKEPAADYPHSIVVDLGSQMPICGLWYTGRNSAGDGGANGRIGDYEIYVSQDQSQYDGDGWVGPVAQGTFANSAEPQLAGFGAVDARYVKLVGLNEVHGYQWATAGEIAVAGPPSEAPTYAPTVTVENDQVNVPEDIHARAAGFAPGENVSFSLQDADGEPASVSVYADAEGNAEANLATTGIAAGDYTVTASGEISGESADTSVRVLDAEDGDSDENSAEANAGSDESNAAGEEDAAAGDEASTDDDVSADGEVSTGGEDGTDGDKSSGAAAASDATASDATGGGAEAQAGDDPGETTHAASSQANGAQAAATNGTGSAVADEAAADTAGDDGSDSLATTGAKVGGIVLLALILLGGGAALIIARRRSSKK